MSKVSVTEQLYQLFVKGLNNGEKISVDGYLGRTDLEGYFKVLHTDFTSKDKFVHQMSRLGLHAVRGAKQPKTGNNYMIYIPPFLANTSLFKETFAAMVQEMDRIKFDYPMALLSGKDISRLGLSNESNEDQYSWRSLEWSAKPQSLNVTNGVYDKELYTEAVIFYVYLNMLSKIKNGIASSVLPKAASIAERNALKLQPVYEWSKKHSGGFRTLYFKPIPTTNKVVKFYKTNDVEKVGTRTKNLSAPDAKLVQENTKCALGKCEIKGDSMARGLLVSGAIKLDKGVHVEALNCDAYNREELNEFGKQLQIALDDEETDTALCGRVKAALKKKYPGN